MNARECLSEVDLCRLWDNDLEPGQRQAFKRHLAGCAQCKARWDEMAADSRYFREMLQREVPASAPGTPCPSDQVKALYIDDALTADEKRTVEEHLLECSLCREHILLTRHLGDAYAREGASWQAEYLGRQVMRLVGAAPEILDDVLALSQAEHVTVIRPRDAIRLPILQPARDAALRLAASTGEGLREQVFQQQDPPCALHLLQVGKELRVEVRVLGQPAYMNCLARLHFTQGDELLCSHVLIIEDGVGQCVLSPSQVKTLRPERVPLMVHVEPLKSLGQLSATGVQAYMPVLAKLLAHEDPSIRRHAVTVLSRIGDSSVRRLIEPLSGDHDEGVRAAVRKALGILPP